MPGVNEPVAAIVTAEGRGGKNSGLAAPAAGRARTTGIGVSRRALLRLLLLCLLCFQALPADWQDPPPALDRSLATLTVDYRFDLVSWELAAIGDKLSSLLQNPAAALSAEESRALVLEYLRLAQRAGQLEDEIERVYSDPDQPDPEQATRGRRTELAVLRRQLANRASVVEAVLERQLSDVIATLGLTTVGVPWPPPRFRFAEPPLLLVVSPRERIERLRSVDLIPDLDSAGRNGLEQAIARDNDLAAYVTGIGGYGAWPTMVVNRYGLQWTTETIAHEWAHNYLAFRPLGWSYLAGGNSVTINETVASIVGEEMGRALLAAYYPDLLPPPTLPDQAGELIEPQERLQPTVFDFGREMRATRLAVDAMLKTGQIAGAERFMQARRQFFVANGYALRVLNQAYFAFHGSYATGPASTDPIGPKLEQLRLASASLRDFLKTVENLTSLAEIDDALAQAEAGG